MPTCKILYCEQVLCHGNPIRDGIAHYYMYHYEQNRKDFLEKLMTNRNIITFTEFNYSQEIPIILWLLLLEIAISNGFAISTSGMIKITTFLLFWNQRCHNISSCIHLHWTGSYSVLHRKVQRWVTTMYNWYHVQGRMNNNNTVNVHV